MFQPESVTLVKKMQNDPDHFRPSVRVVELEKTSSSFGFELTRSKWDPYPWICTVQEKSGASEAGLKTGDCLLEIEGRDIVGMKISDIAEMVKSKTRKISLLLWNAGVDSKCTPEAICCGPMPRNLQRLSACMSAILTFLECPVCLDTIQPPSYQCENGHLICINCRMKSERCPVCRLRYNKTRSLLCDQVYNALISGFDLKDEPENERSIKIRQIFKTKKNIPAIRINQCPNNDINNKGFLGRFLGRSMDNLRQNNCEDLTTRSQSSQELSDCPRTQRLSPSRPASCNGSLESLRTNPVDKFYCPFSTNCTCRLDNDKIIEHFRNIHPGTLVQIFESSIKIKLSKVLKRKSLCYVVQLDEVFFLRMELERSKDDELKEELFLWTWIQGDKHLANDYSMRLEVANLKNAFISVRSNICALTSESYQELQLFKKGISMNLETLHGLCSSPKNVTLEIDIVRNNE